MPVPTELGQRRRRLIGPAPDEFLGLGSHPRVDAREHAPRSDEACIDQADQPELAPAGPPALQGPPGDPLPRCLQLLHLGIQPVTEGGRGRIVLRPRFARAGVGFLPGAVAGPGLQKVGKAKLCLLQLGLREELRSGVGRARCRLRIGLGADESVAGRGQEQLHGDHHRDGLSFGRAEPGEGSLEPFDQVAAPVVDDPRAGAQLSAHRFVR